MNWRFFWGVVVASVGLGFARPGLGAELHAYVSALVYLVMWLAVRQKPSPGSKPSRAPLALAAAALLLVLGASARTFPDTAMILIVGMWLVLGAGSAYVLSLTVRHWVDGRLLKL